MNHILRLTLVHKIRAMALGRYTKLVLRQTAWNATACLMDHSRGLTALNLISLWMFVLAGTRPGSDLMFMVQHRPSISCFQEGLTESSKLPTAGSWAWLDISSCSVQRYNGNPSWNNLPLAKRHRKHLVGPTGHCVATGCFKQRLTIITVSLAISGDR